jgi:hypothetical protein
MPNRQLTETERNEANRVLTTIRGQLKELAGDDSALLFALRRKVYKELVYDERGKPMHRRKLKALKAKEQNGVCGRCGNPLSASGNVLDRTEAMPKV